MNKYLVEKEFTIDRVYLKGETVELNDKTAKDLLGWGNISKYVEPEPQPEVRAVRKKATKEETPGDRSPGVDEVDISQI